MVSFAESRRMIENEGVYIGGWSIKNAFVPDKTRGLGKIEQTNAIVDWDAAEERKLVRKIDTRVLLPCCILYFLAYLDRANMGYAGVLQADTPDNMRTDLNLQGIQFNWAISITYFMVTAFLIPSNLAMKKYSGKFFFPCIMIGFGGIAMCIGAVQNAAGLLATRFFLGLPESGVVPACVMYFSFWYKPSERAFRIGIFHAANALASGVGGFLANGINSLNGAGGLPAWRWVFIIEGAMSVAMALPVYFLLLTFPETTTAFNDRERHIAVNRFGRGATRHTDVTWDTHAFFQMFSRPSTYMFFASYICILIVATSLGSFLPIILHEFTGFEAEQANRYTAAIYFVKIPLYFIWSWHTDYTREQMWHYLLPVLASIPCWAIWTYVGSRQSYSGIAPIALYGVAFLGNLVSIAQPAALAYRTSTAYGAAEQAVGVASGVAALSISSIIGPQIFPEPDEPWYLAGFSTGCATLTFSVLGFSTLPLLYLYEAKQRKKRTGHAMPLRALEDALHAQVSEGAREHEREVAAAEVKGPIDEEAGHIESVDLDQRK